MNGEQQLRRAKLSNAFDALVVVQFERVDGRPAREDTRKMRVPHSNCITTGALFVRVISNYRAILSYKGLPRHYRHQIKFTLRFDAPFGYETNAYPAESEHQWPITNQSRSPTNL